MIGKGQWDVELQFVPAPDRLIEKSVRPSDVGLSEICYESS
jgi:hypothetical protein